VTGSPLQAHTPWLTSVPGPSLRGGDRPWRPAYSGRWVDAVRDGGAVGRPPRWLGCWADRRTRPPRTGTGMRAITGSGAMRREGRDGDHRPRPGRSRRGTNQRRGRWRCGGCELHPRPRGGRRPRSGRMVGLGRHGRVGADVDRLGVWRCAAAGVTATWSPSDPPFPADDTSRFQGNHRDSRRPGRTFRLWPGTTHDRGRLMSAVERSGSSVTAGQVGWTGPAGGAQCLGGPAGAMLAGPIA
jgi:hypothetical protein